MSWNSRDGMFSSREPGGVDSSDQTNQRFEPERLHQVGIGPDVVRALDVILQFRAGKYEHGQLTQLRMLPNPFEDLESRGARHFEIEQNERRQGKAVAVGIDPQP